MALECEEKIQQTQRLHSKPLTVDDGRYKTLFEQVNAAAFLTTLDGKILEANQKSCELFEYSWEELLQESLQAFLPKQTDWSQFVDEIAARGGLHIETETYCKDGKTIPIELSISLFQLNKQPVMFVLIWDITQRKQAEKRLRENEEKYRGLFEYTTDGMVVLDARGDIIEVNSRLAELLETTKESLLGKSLFDLPFFTMASLPLVIGQFKQLLSEKTATTYTTEVITGAGSSIDVEISSFFLVKKDNEVDNFVMVIRDSTAKNEAEQQRKQEHELLKTLLENIPDSVYFKDDKNQFVLVNRAKADHWSVSPEEMIGKTDFDFLPKEQAQKAFDDDMTIIRTGTPIIDKLEVITGQDGVQRCFSVTKVPWFNAEGAIIGTMGISRDVTKWQHTE